MAIVALRSLNLRDKKVLVRCDFNVPLADGEIADSGRIDASLETIRHILGQGGAAVLCSHLGRPKERSSELSLKPVARYLSRTLERTVPLAPDCIGDATTRMISALGAGEALLLENLRFHPEEEANALDFSRELARGKHVYVNEAFGAAHRAHASIVGITRFFPVRAAGFLMLREIEALRAVTENPERPYVVILGGAKVSDKIAVIRSLMKKAGSIAIGGAMAYTFLRAQGVPIGKSRAEEDRLDLARDLIAEAAAQNVKLMLPIDHVFAKAPQDGVKSEAGAQIPDGMMGLDIGPATVELFAAEIARAKTVVWNGPLGLFEIPAFAAGTMKVGEALAFSNARSFIGGGDTAAALAHAPWASRFSHISTGGGATLEFLEGRELPGIKALET